MATIMMFPLLSNYPITSYGGSSQDIEVVTTWENDGNTLKMMGNGWKKIAFPYTVTPDTILEFDFKSSHQGEIHGIGFDNDNAISPDFTFNLYGSQNWGIQELDNYQDLARGWKHYRIRVGDFYQGNMSYLTLTNDHDVSNPTAESLFANVKVYDNKNPIAVDDYVTTQENNPLTILPNDLLANDSDGDGDRLNLTGVQNVSHGSITLDTNRNIVFTPESNFKGIGSFQYLVSDERGGYDWATVNVNISASVSTSSIPLGTNLAGVVDWSTQVPFIDVFKSSRQWITQSDSAWDTEESNLLDLDENGWVKSLPDPEDASKYSHIGTLLFTDTASHYHKGRYVVLYEGEGTLEYRFDAQIDEVPSRPGRDVIHVTPNNGGIYLLITATDPKNTGNYIRNIRVIPEAYESSPEIFNQDFLEKTQSYSSLRFMNWMQTNDSSQKEWSDRPQLTDSTWATKGIPVEVMVTLANRLDIDPWFTIPHQATDEYVTKFAQYVRDHLEPERKVYVEYSNEVWNWMFQQSHWIDQQAKNDPEFKGNWINWYGKRTTEITQIWDKVFDVTGQKARVIGVMGAQAANTWLGEQALNYSSWSSENKSHADYGIDAIAIAPYFGGYLGSPENQAEVQTWNLDQLFDELNEGGVLSGGPQGGALEEAYGWMKSYAELAKQENLELLAYEGGQHLVGHHGVENHEAITKLFIEANRDPRMGELYKQYLTQWYQQGGDLFMNFIDIGTSSKWGSWGTLEYLNQDSSPKYDALMDLLNGSGDMVPLR